MRFVQRTTPNIAPRNGTASMRAVLAQGPQGLPGPGAAAWAASTAVTTGAIRQWPDGSWVKSLGNRTTGATPDATEATFWAAVLGTAGTVEATALSTAYVAVGRLAFDAKNYGATGDGTTNDTAAIQAAIDAAVATMPGTGYGTSFMAMVTVHLPPGVYKASGLVLPGRVHLTGSGARIKAASSGPILTLNGEANRVSGIMFDGNGVAMNSNGIVCSATAFRYHIHDVKFQDFAGRAILTEASSIGYMDHIFAQNCLLDDASLSTYTGVVEMQGNDSTLSFSELTASRASLSAGGFVGALAITGSTSGNHSIGPGVVAEISDFGVYVAGPGTASHKLTDVRADLNWGHGWIIVSGVGQLANCHSYRNGRTAANTYNGFQVSGGQFDFSNCLAECSASSHLIGFNDTQNSDASKNWYDGCRSIGAGLKGFQNTSVGARIEIPSGPEYISIGTTTTWNVDQLVDIKAVNTVATTLLAWTNGFFGQRIRVRGDGFTTIPHTPSGTVASGQAFRNRGGTDLLLLLNVVYEYERLDTGIWTQIGGAPAAADSVLLTTGEETIARDKLLFSQTVYSVAMASQDMRGAQFLARKTETITQVKVVSGTTAATATPSLCRIGVYSVDASGNYTLVASTANDTTLFAAANTVYTRTLSASFVKTAGVRYVVAVLVVSAAAMPSLVGLGASSEYTIAPVLATRVTAQADLPASFTTAGTQGSASPIYAVLLP